MHGGQAHTVNICKIVVVIVHCSVHLQFVYAGIVILIMCCMGRLVPYHMVRAYVSD